MPTVKNCDGHFAKREQRRVHRAELRQDVAPGVRAIDQRPSDRFVPVPGGVLVLDTDGKAIGAVGISGDTSEKDEICAIQGIKAAGLASAPSEPNESWKASSL